MHTVHGGGVKGTERVRPERVVPVERVRSMREGVLVMDWSEKVILESRIQELEAEVRKLRTAIVVLEARHRTERDTNALHEFVASTIRQQP